MTPRPPLRPRDTRLIRLFGVAVSVAAVVLLVVTLDVRDSFVVLSSAALLPLLVALPIVGLQVLVRSARWRLLLPRRPDGDRARFSSVTSALLIGYLGNAVLPARLGEPIRAAVVGRAERIPIGGALGSVVLERVVDTAVLSVIGLAAAIAIGAPGWIVNLAVFVSAIGVSLLVLLATVGLDPFLAAARWVAARLPGHIRGVARSGLDRLGTFVDGVSGHRKRPDVLAAAGLSGIGWLLDATIFALVGFAIGLPLQPGEALVISAVGALATAIPSAPGFLGTFEVAVTAAALAMGATSAQGLALALATHAIVLGPIVVGGLMALARTGSTLGALAGSSASETELDRAVAPS
jgi:glycosyltransferase 2 family protein